MLPSSRQSPGPPQVKSEHVNLTENARVLKYGRELNSHRFWTYQLPTDSDEAPLMRRRHSGQLSCVRSSGVPQFVQNLGRSALFIGREDVDTDTKRPFSRFSDKPTVGSRGHSVA